MAEAICTGILKTALEFFKNSGGWNSVSFWVADVFLYTFQAKPQERL